MSPDGQGCPGTQLSQKGVQRKICRRSNGRGESSIDLRVTKLRARTEDAPVSRLLPMFFRRDLPTNTQFGFALRGHIVEREALSPRGAAQQF